MKKRVIQIMGIFLCLQFCYIPTNAKEILHDESKEIIETIPIVPDVMILLENEVRETKGWDEDISDNTIQITQADAEMLMKIAWSEAGNQGVEGQARVMMVVWNRVLSPNYPDTVYGVISQRGQFESFINGTYNIAQPTYETHEALALFEKNLQHDDSIIAFETKVNGRSLEKYFTYCYTQGEHDFYVTKKN